jgi:TolB-like protein
LTYLNLLGNSLTGAITAELNRMGQLQVLDLSMNNTASLQHN